jgi:hypothetical protein
MINHYNGEKTSDNAVLQAVKRVPRIVHRNATKQIIAPAHPCPQPFAKPASAMLVHRTFSIVLRFFSKASTADAGCLDLSHE